MPSPPGLRSFSRGDGARHRPLPRRQAPSRRRQLVGSFATRGGSALDASGPASGGTEARVASGRGAGTLKGRARAGAQAERASAATPASGCRLTGRAGLIAFKWRKSPKIRGVQRSHPGRIRGVPEGRAPRRGGRGEPSRSPTASASGSGPRSRDPGADRRDSHILDHRERRRIARPAARSPGARGPERWTRGPRGRGTRFADSPRREGPRSREDRDALGVTGPT